MKILTVNFLTCAVKTCKSSPESFPLHFRDAELEQSDVAYNPDFVRNILPRVDWEALKVTAVEVSKTNISFLVYNGVRGFWVDFLLSVEFCNFPHFEENLVSLKRMA